MKRIILPSSTLTANLEPTVKTRATHISEKNESGTKNQIITNLDFFKVPGKREGEDIIYFKKLVFLIKNNNYSIKLSLVPLSPNYLLLFMLMLHTAILLGL